MRQRYTGNKWARVRREGDGWVIRRESSAPCSACGKEEGTHQYGHESRGRRVGTSVLCMACYRAGR